MAEYIDAAITVLAYFFGIWVGRCWYSRCEHNDGPDG
jgi:hypothetical protein